MNIKTAPLGLAVLVVNYDNGLFTRDLAAIGAAHPDAGTVPVRP